MTVRVTICEWHGTPDALQRDWERLVQHVRAQDSELVVLPETPFSAWFAGGRDFDPDVWAASIAAHDAWELRAQELAPAVIVSTRPMDFGNERYDEAVIIDRGGLRSVHAKSHLSHQAGAWESSWYQPATADFVPVNVADARIGVLLGAELWLLEQARLYGEVGIDILVTPRASGPEHFGRWLAAGRRAALRAHAFSLSSNRVGGDFDGHGWAISPAGEILTLTNADEPFASLTLDLPARRRARARLRRRIPVSITAPVPPAPAPVDVPRASTHPGESVMSPMLVEELMTKTVYTCAPEDSLSRAAQIMWERDCGCLPVCSTNGATHVVGMVTDRDICMCALFQGRPLAELMVSQAMSSQVRACQQSDTIAAVERSLAEARVRRMPVLDEHGALAGIVALADFAREAARQRARPQQELTQAQIGDAYVMICEPMQQSSS